MRLLRDSAGKASWHWTLAIPALILGTAWFLAGGVDVTLPGGWHVVTATKSGSDYLLYVSPWLAATGHRDWLEKKVGGGDGNS